MLGRPEHLDLFEKGIARKLDFSFAGTQSLRISQLIEDGLLEIGAIHTYIELYSRLLVDLIPVVLSAGFMADREGNIYTGASTEDSPALIEPAYLVMALLLCRLTNWWMTSKIYLGSIFLPLGRLCGGCGG